MKYYKIIVDENIIGVVTDLGCFRFQQKHSMLERTSDQEAEYIGYNGTLYHAWWMRPIKTESYTYQLAQITEITEQEYNILAPISEPIPIEEEEEPPIELPEEPVDPTEEITIDYVRTAKISELSLNCRRTIEAGFDLDIRGETKHFSLTTQDQLNLMSLSITIQTQTQSLIPYHADGEECEFYTVEEINQIISEATTFKNYHLSYYNSLKAYINTLDTIEAIAAITYGTPVPDEYKSDVLKVLE